MSIFEIFDLASLLTNTQFESMSIRSCSSSIEDECRNDAVALRMKFIAIGSILVAGAIGVSIPLIGKKRRILRTDGGVFVFMKAFAAGVILATGFVHMLHDGESALTNSCLPKFPWKKFPFSGFTAMVAALLTLIVDFVGTQFYEKKHREEEIGIKREAAEVVAANAEVAEIVPAVDGDVEAGGSGDGKMHIVGMHAHAAAHRHSHAHGDARACKGHGSDEGHGHGHGHMHDEDGHVSSHVRHVVVSQILELGIVSHSVIIGLSLGVSQSPCTIRPLIAALSFHQFFEGFALGGCISQAKFKTLSAALMACFFAITTPMGIAVGIAISSVYNANSPKALVVEGILDSTSAGILIYMALVDLIAADFLSRKMSCNVRLQIASYLALLLGALSMSSLAIWA